MSKITLTLGAAVLLGAVLAVQAWLSHTPPADDEATAPSLGPGDAPAVPQPLALGDIEAASAAQDRPLSRDQGPAEAPPADAAPESDLRRLIADGIFDLRRALEPAEREAISTRLREAFRQADAEIAAAVVAEFLATGEDAPTGLPFTVGPDGVLASAPTLRVMLLDLLPALDPDAAVTVARHIMDAKASPEEYAMSLRNLAWNDFQGDMQEEVTAGLQAMLAVEEWRANPAPAYLEAFDAAVQIPGPRAAEILAGLIDANAAGGDAAAQRIRHAAFVALDRIALRDPAVVVAMYRADSTLFAHSPDHRASLMSRLDLRDAEQRATFRNYLARGDHGDGELSYFAELFPNGNYIHTNRLVSTSEDTPSIAERQALDVETLAHVSGLRAASPPGPIADTLSRIENRLLRYTAAADPSARAGLPR